MTTSIEKTIRSVGVPVPASELGPMPGQVVQHTMRAKLQELERELATAESSRSEHEAYVYAYGNRIASIKAARAEIADFLEREAPKP
jgi:hypothetical protein